MAALNGLTVVHTKATSQTTFLTAMGNIPGLMVKCIKEIGCKEPCTGKDCEYGRMEKLGTMAILRRTNKHGHGIFTWKNGNRYEGKWKKGKMHGEGVMVIGNKIKRGIWKEGAFVKILKS